MMFGDLRPCNILVGNNTTVLIDFDRCGKAGKDHYPPKMNLDRCIDWLDDVGPHRLMSPDHDLYMLAKADIVIHNLNLEYLKNDHFLSLCCLHLAHEGTKLGIKPVSPSPKAPLLSIQQKKDPTTSANTPCAKALGVTGVHCPLQLAST